ncbi:MAE_28990/MAE_18760 family HEPN-like nuclease [Amycolatopsis coloradensis]|uniref:MAE_28990/MAE_18760 family HEPN-like nuclease n=1 Tax=Amycolatopsis coloradensis TaxID=76021 RepID=A0ACD5B7P2_9PSEU
MNSADLLSFFDDRFAEIEDYVSFLEDVEKAAQLGAPKIGSFAARISPAQQKILYSSLYLQLYNLVEAAVSLCVDSVVESAVRDGRWRVDDLNESMRREWVRSMARTHQSDMAPDNRLNSALKMCEHLINQLPVASFQVERGGGGNWDDESIYEITKRLGCKLSISPATNALAKRSIRDNLGPLKLVKDRRNGLAHGSVSFADCADGVTVSELKMVAEAVGKYLREVITCIGTYVDLKEFLNPAGMPASVNQ